MGPTLKIKTNYLLLSLSFGGLAAHASPDGLWFFAGGAVGIEKVSTSIETEASKSGFHLLGKGLASYYMDSFVGDVGGGFTFSKVSGSTETEDVSLTMKSLVMETSFRYRLHDFQVGPMLQYLFGTDLSYSELVEDKKSSMIMLGLHLAYDMELGDNILRFGAQALRDFSDSDRTISRYLIEINYGFGGSHKSSSSSNDEPVQEEESSPEESENMDDQAAMAPQEAPQDNLAQEDTTIDALDLDTIESAPPVAPVPPAIISQPATRSTKGGVVVRLPTDRFLFDTAMSHLKSPAATQYIQSLGFFLEANSSAWEKVEILGHTDARGKKRVNKELSEGRARTVYNVLVKAGVDTSRMSYKGLGATKPLSKKRSAKAHAMNRRVELKFTGVTQPELFTSQINELDQKYRYGTYKNPQPTSSASPLPSMDESPYVAPAESTPTEMIPELAPDNTYAPMDSDPVENVPDTLSSPDDYLNSPDFEQF